MMPSQYTGLVKHQGSALTLAVFIIVVMALLASALIKMLSSSNESVAVEVYGARALQAATTGVEYMSSLIFPTDASATDTGAIASNACSDLSATTLNVTLPTSSTLGLAGCSFSVTCQDRVIDVADAAPAENVRYYRFVSTGTCDATDWSASRTVQVEAKALNYE
ncbi:hypothetical protein C2869_21460 [Saccharobesus litoralis]|uniref:MSHA biogenesis protein MshP n=1 Tax=Saccharobesus litoralis TaxID=2172099 RepID=A0A2S0VX86_9ALTE|nr:hypothetical protein [Saccharobesus litoralis]AWB68808.1 hypothetical protein C2869_21460 [Saccharobesus litoralis]